MTHKNQVMLSYGFERELMGRVELNMDGERVAITLEAQWTCVCAQSLQLCLTLRDTVGCRTSGSSVHGILQASILEYWSGFPCPSAGVLPSPGMEPTSSLVLYCRQILCHWATREVPVATWCQKVKKDICSNPMFAIHQASHLNERHSLIY